MGILKIATDIRLHRFRQYIAVSINNHETVYLDEGLARALGRLLVNGADDIENNLFEHSAFNTCQIKGA